MQIPVLVEPIANGFRARSGEPLVLSAEGATREESLQKLREAVQKATAGGAELTSLEVGSVTHPLLRFAGIWKEGDPLIKEWMQAMEEYRREVDADPDYL